MPQKVYFLKIALFNVMERIMLMGKNELHHVMARLEHGNILLKVYDIQYFKRLHKCNLLFLISDFEILIPQTKN